MHIPRLQTHQNQLINIYLIFSFIGERLKGVSLEYYGIISPPKNETGKTTYSIELHGNREVAVNVVQLLIDDENCEK